MFLNGLAVLVVVVCVRLLVEVVVDALVGGMMRVVVAVRMVAGEAVNVAVVAIDVVDVVVVAATGAAL